MHRPNGLVTLLTDFGSTDGYAGAMRGAALAAASDVRLVDLTHEIPRHDVSKAAYVLAFAGPAFPAGTTHCVVVDPGVGSSRQALAVAAGDHYFVGPDNGVLWPAIAAAAAGAEIGAFRLTLPAGASTTFHGRDLFAPAAARIATGRLTLPSLDRADEPSRLDMPSPRAVGPGRWQGAVLAVDGFGNVVTTFGRTPDFAGLVSDTFRLSCGPVQTSALRSCYDEIFDDEVFCIWGSGGHLELSLRQGSAANRIRPEGRGPWPVVVLELSSC